MPEKIENRMVMDLQRSDFPAETKEKLSGSGYKKIGSEIFVPEEDAFDYALIQCMEIPPDGILKTKWTQDFRDMLVEWFYSENWIRVE